MTTDTIKKEAYEKPPFFISYFITDPQEFGNTPEKLEKSLRSTLSANTIDIVCFRDKISHNKKELAKVCLQVAREYNIKKVLINSDISLCEELDFDGIHLNSSQFKMLKKCKKDSLFTIISCHTEDEVRQAKALKANAVTYSPIFFKKFKGKPKGIENLTKMVNRYQDREFSIFALGGIITMSHIQDIIKTQAKGFASIRYFKV